MGKVFLPSRPLCHFCGSSLHFPGAVSHPNELTDTTTPKESVVLLHLLPCAIAQPESNPARANRHHTHTHTHATRTRAHTNTRMQHGRAHAQHTHTIHTPCTHTPTQSASYDSTVGRVLGRVLVENIAFEKHVWVRYTTDNWASHTDLPCTYDGTSPWAPGRCVSVCACACARARAVCVCMCVCMCAWSGNTCGSGTPPTTGLPTRTSPAHI